MMNGWEHQYNPQEPVVDLEGYAELFAQSLSLDLGDLFEEPEAVVYPGDRKARMIPEGTVVGLLDKEALLAELEHRLEQHPEMREAEAFEVATPCGYLEEHAVAHGEDVSQWVESIQQALQQEQNHQLSLMQLQE